MHRNHVIAALAAGLGLVAAPVPASAGLFDKLGEKLEDTVSDGVSRATGRAAERQVDDVLDGKPAKKASPSQPQRARKGQQVQPEDEAQEPEAGSAATTAAGTTSKAEGGALSGEVFSNKYDFVPGETVLVYDDFSEDDVGEHPARWTFKDGGGGNPIEVVQAGKQRFMKSKFLDKEQDGSRVWLRYAIKGDMPKKFTMEFDADLSGGLAVHFSAPHGFGGQSIYMNRYQDGRAQTAEVDAAIPQALRTGLHHVAISVSNNLVKLYVGGERILSDPDGVERPVKRLGLEFLNPSHGGGDRQMLTNFRLAEGGKDAKVLLASGRIVTHGILFDTGSDVLRPESGPTLRSILAILQEDPGLKFRIEGHTDDQGSAALNGPLSEKRAAAVKAWLVKQGIADARLEAKGLGSTKPLDPGATPEARANNRRVELVKL